MGEQGAEEGWLMKQVDKLLKRLEHIQDTHGDNKPILVSIMILVGEDGELGCWFVNEYKRAEG